MKRIAFKRAGKNKSLHPLFITEYIEISYLDSTEGYEVLPEDQFDKELSMNDSRHSEHLDYLKSESEKRRLLAFQKNAQEQKDERELEREYRRFKAFQKHKGRDL